MNQPQAPRTSPQSNHAPGLERIFQLVPQEGSYSIHQVEGEIPRFLQGTAYWNGPARFVREDLNYTHWLDGDGMVAALHFAEGEIHFTNRFVRSSKWMEEEEAGQALYRTFGTAFEGDALQRGIALASPVNVSVYQVGGRLLAFGEQGLPWELDPKTLETVGEHTFERRLNVVSPFSAHPIADPNSGEFFNFGVSFASAQPVLTLYRFDPEGKLLYRKRHPLPFPCSLHDFGLSPRYAIFYLAPYVMDVQAFLRQGATVQQALSWQPERGSRLLVASRETGELVADLPIGQRYCLHQINAFEDGDHRLVVDVLELEEPAYPEYEPLPDLFQEKKRARPVRLIVDPIAGQLVERHALAHELAADFPALLPSKEFHSYENFWMLSIAATGKPGRKFLDTLVRVNWKDDAVADSYRCPPGRYLAGEPILVEDPSAREEAVLLVPELAIKPSEPSGTSQEGLASSFLLFDPFQLHKGPTARIPLENPLHLAFHGSFSPRQSGTDN